MNSRHLVSFLVLIILYSPLEAQKTAPPYLGTKTPYYPFQEKHTPPPKGYKPVFINYVGRHGARFLTKAGSDVLVLDVLQQALQANALTATGKQVLQAAAQFESVEKGNYENITLLGAEEQTDIASRIYNEYRNVFKQKGLTVLMTGKVRTQQSAEAFLKGIPAYPVDKIHRITGSNSADTILRFYDLSPVYNDYRKGKTVQQHLDSLYNNPKTKEIADRICKRIFKNNFLLKITNNPITADDGQGKEKPIDKIAFAAALYDLYTIQFSMTEELQKQFSGKTKSLFKEAFSLEDLQWLDLVNEAEDFFEKGPAADTLGIQVSIAAPLLVNFLSTADSVLSGLKASDAILRFTHAEAISPFTTLLGIPQASVQSNSVYKYHNHWQASQVIPLSANVQWIFYSNGKQYLMKTLLNEKEVALPLLTSSFPYYNWVEVKSYYLKKLMKLKSRR